MTIPPPDGSRDRRIEDLSNLYLIHPAARALLPVALARHVSANMVSLGGLALGLGATLAFSRVAGWPGALLGLFLAIGWLVADGLDGMIARATGTASAAGRILDGLCDHGVFLLIYLGFAASIGTAAAWTTAVAAGIAHAVQSSLYEGERARFHRRLHLKPPPPRSARVPVYDWVAQAADRMGERLDGLLASPSIGPALAVDYAARSVAPMRAMALLSANVRVLAIAIACALRDPTLFWWFELGPLTVVTVLTMVWQRHVEGQVVETWDERDAALSRNA